MPSYSPDMMMKRFGKKPDIHSKAVDLITRFAMAGTGPFICFKSGKTRDILRGLMGYTGWNMILVGNIPSPSKAITGNENATKWAEVIQMAVDVELGDSAPRIGSMILTSYGIMIRWIIPLKKKKKNREAIVLGKISKAFSQYESWGSAVLRPVIAEE